MTLKAKKITLLIIIGMSLSQFNSILYRISPRISGIQYDLFWSPTYHQNLSVAWYVYEIANILNRVIWCYVFCVLAKLYNRKLYYAGLVFLFYYLSQFILYAWDRNTNIVSSCLVYGATFAVVIQFLIPKAKKDEASKIT